MWSIGLSVMVCTPLASALDSVAHRDDGMEETVSRCDIVGR